MAEENNIESSKKELEERIINELFTFIREGIPPTKATVANLMECHNILYINR